jgi:hypothetical protein
MAAVSAATPRPVGKSAEVGTAHFFRHFLHDAHPAYTPEEIDRYVEAWSQPGAATGMINYYLSSVRQSPKRAEASASCSLWSVSR